jgi:hypothetical protein
VCRVAQIDNIKERSEVDALLNGVYHYFQAIADLSKEKSACCVLCAFKRFSVLVSNTNNHLCARPVAWQVQRLAARRKRRSSATGRPSSERPFFTTSSTTSSGTHTLLSLLNSPHALVSL